VSELHKLTALTKLRLGYYDVDTSGSLCECVRGIASLTQLLFFNLGTNSTEATVGCLMPLTNLTALTNLKWYHARGQSDVVLRTSTQVSKLLVYHCLHAYVVQLMATVHEQ
jgi:hypothetical protein